ncbi:hypothetical protein NUW58_g6012 [Xylaria curta]|uniref:Uncharacterized protein n=1 Tax=Xylaria curta TaxID=42375 RepID=A0ACC1P1C2_9PEZI|nr:hypothetical protein NUW58_g6012 [Xylaria curta]
MAVTADEPSPTQDTIHTIPETLANGGVIGDKCFKCAEKHVRLKSIQLLTDLARNFKTARRKAEDLGTDEAIKGMRKAQEAFERVPVDDFSTLSKIRHHQW